MIVLIYDTDDVAGSQIREPDDHGRYADAYADSHPAPRLSLGQLLAQAELAGWPVTLRDHDDWLSLRPPTMLQPTPGYEGRAARWLASSVPGHEDPPRAPEPLIRRRRRLAVRLSHLEARRPLRSPRGQGFDEKEASALRTALSLFDEAIHESLGAAP